MFSSIQLAIFSSRLNAICEEMGHVLKRSALSPNIKDRQDFSCAFFDSAGRMCAQAAHIPVHLGSMAYAMVDLVGQFEWEDGDVVVLNDPFMGGTHLPDVTVITPVYQCQVLLGFVANRAHHANIGSSSPGSMPLSREIEEEGVLISPVKLFRAGVLDESILEMLAQIEHEGSKSSLPGDFQAQVSANAVGRTRLLDWLGEDVAGHQYLESGIRALNEYGRELSQKAFTRFAKGTGRFRDVMDSDGFGNENIAISVEVTINESGIIADFSGTDSQVAGNLNCPISVTAAAVYYVFICLLPSYVPRCHAVFEQIRIFAPECCLVNARGPAAVAAGNVETSMRIVDVVLGALGELGLDVPAASQGTMNNVALGGRGGKSDWDYYETLGGGMGASSSFDGFDAVQCHMTNTLNTPVESLESHYPLRIDKYAIRRGSGGRGANAGGDGLIRTYRFLEPTAVTLLTERRVRPPWGVQGGGDAEAGKNVFNDHQLDDKAMFVADAGDELSIETPGGGGWGAKNIP